MHITLNNRKPRSTDTGCAVAMNLAILFAIYTMNVEIQNRTTDDQNNLETFLQLHGDE